MSRKNKYELTDEVKDKIIDYCYLVLEEYVDTTYLLSKNIDVPILLEYLYHFSIHYYTTTGNFEIDSSDLDEIYLIIQTMHITYEQLLANEIELLAINKDETLVFNLEPSNKVFYNKKTKNWEKINNNE